MKRRSRPLFVLHRDRVLHARLRTVVRQRGLSLHAVEEWDDLHDALRVAPSSAVIVVDPFWGAEQPGELSVDLAALLHRYPSASVTAALALAPGSLELARRLGEWGVVQVIDLDEDVSAVELDRRLLSVTGKPLRNLVAHSLPPSLGAAARAIFAAAAAVATEEGDGGDLARRFCVTPRTLSRWCRRSGMPPPKRLLAWMRILLAAELLDDPGRSISDVALSCGYASDGSLRYSLRAFVGETPSTLRDGGAFRSVSQAFLRDLLQARNPATRYRSQSSGAA